MKDDAVRQLAMSIARDAADAVNTRWQKKQELEPSPTFARQIAQPIKALGMTATSPFSFEILPEQSALLSEDEKSELSQWCKEEVKNRIALDGRDLAGMILGYAKQGKNFFDQWHS